MPTPASLEELLEWLRRWEVDLPAGRFGDPGQALRGAQNYPPSAINSVLGQMGEAADQTLQNRRDMRVPGVVMGEERPVLDPWSRGSGRSPTQVSPSDLLGVLRNLPKTSLANLLGGLGSRMNSPVSPPMNQAILMALLKEFLPQAERGMD